MSKLISVSVIVVAVALWSPVERPQTACLARFSHCADVQQPWHHPDEPSRQDRARYFGQSVPGIT
ncbi:MAG TPA: hypothetical protein VK822_26895, partial [Acetobacteraceae bacterium]|nr:hypothetical protein [Acetobacteraceae bacterium]